MNPQGMQKLVLIRIRWEQGGQDGGAGGHQGASGPPDVEPVRGREWRHGRPFAEALDPDLGNGQPGFDEAFGHDQVALLVGRGNLVAMKVRISGSRK